MKWLLLWLSFADAALQFTGNLSTVYLGSNILNRTNSTQTPCHVCINTDFNTEFCTGNDPVQHPTTTSLVLPSFQITLEAWIKVDFSLNATSTVNVIGMYSGARELQHQSQTGFRLGFHQNFPVFGLALNYVDFLTTNGTVKVWSHENQAVSGPPASMWRPDRWYHIAGSFDGVYKRLYIDGELMESYQPPPSTGIYYGDSKFFLGGTWDCNGSASFPGSMAEVRMWNISRNQTDILTWRDQAIAPNTPGLIGLWRQVSNGNVKDETATQPVGVINGSVTNDGSVAFPPPQDNSPKWVETPRCKPYTGTLCSRWIDYPIYDLHPQQDYEQASGQFQGFLVFATPDCQAPITKLLCLTYFPKCANKTVEAEQRWDGLPGPPPTMSFNISVPLPVCRDVCDDVARLCSYEVKLAFSLGKSSLMYNALYQDAQVFSNPCIDKAKDSYHFNNSLVTFPTENATFYAFGHYKYAFNCKTDYANLSVASLPVLECPYPTVLNRDPNYDRLQQIGDYLVRGTAGDIGDFLETPSCTTGCPLPIFTSIETYPQFYLMCTSMSIITFVVTFGCVCYILTQPQQRKFPGILLTMVVICVCGLSFSLVISPMAGYRDYFCVTENRGAVQGDNAACDAQAILVQFFAMSVVLYWGTMIFYLSRVMAMRVPAERYGPLFVILPGSISLLTVIIAVSTSSMGLAFTGNMCWINAEGLEQFIRSSNTEDATAWALLASSWGLFYAIALAVVVFNMYVLFSYAKNKVNFSVQDAAFGRMWKMALVLLAFFSLSLTFQIVISSQSASFRETFGNVRKCKVLGDIYSVLLTLGENPASPRAEKFRTTGGFTVNPDGSANTDACPTYYSDISAPFVFFEQFFFHSLGLWVCLILYSAAIRKAIFSKWERLSSRDGSDWSNSADKPGNKKGSHVLIHKGSKNPLKGSTSSGTFTEMAEVQSTSEVRPDETLAPETRKQIAKEFR